MPQVGDAFGHMLWDVHAGAENVLEIIERDDGFVDTGPASRYFDPFRAWMPHERAAMRYVRGRVLDVGAGAGRHSLYLQDRGHTVTAIDPSPLAAKVCRARGLKSVRRVSLRRLGEAARPFDTVLLLGNNFGVLDSPKQAVRHLRRLARFTSDGARILAGTNNVYAPSAPKEHLAYHALNRARGRWPGQLRLRVRYRGLATPWFNYLMVSPEEMESIVAETPWHIESLVGERSGLYVAVLSRRMPGRSGPGRSIGRRSPGARSRSAQPPAQ